MTSVYFEWSDGWNKSNVCAAATVAGTKSKDRRRAGE